MIRIIGKIFWTSLAITLFSCGDPVDQVSVVDISPGKDIVPGTNITWTFSKDMVVDSLIGVNLSGSLIEFDPEVRGVSRWIDSRRLRFFPDDKLRPSSSYRATLSKDLAKNTALKFTGDREFVFETENVKIKSASLHIEYSPESRESVTLVSSLEFNYPVSASELKGKTRIVSPDGRTYAVQIEDPEDGSSHRMIVENVSRAEEEKELSLVVDEGLKAIGGDIGTKGQFIHPISLPGQEDLRVLSVKPLRTAPGQGTVVLDFNIPINNETIQNALSISPNVDYSVTTNGRKVELRGKFKSSESYLLKIGKSIRAIDGTEFGKMFSQSVSFLEDDIDPQIDFVGSGFYLTKGGQTNVGINSVNVDQLSISIDRIFENNIVHLANEVKLSPGRDDWYYDYLNLPRFGEEIESFEIPVQNDLNDEITSVVELDKILDSDFKGIYRITARMKNRRWVNSVRYVIATDLGLLAKKSDNDLWVWSHDLLSLAPSASSVVRVYSQNNQLLAETNSSVNGLAIFDGVFDTDKRRPYLVSVEQNDDVSFLELSKRQVPTASFEVDGRSSLKSGYDAFLYGERDIYRPGETAHLAGIVRGRNASLPDQFPLRLKVIAPDGRAVEEIKGSMNEQAAMSFNVEIPEYYQTGRYTASLMLGEDKEIGRTRFSVEEFIPDRMKVKVSSAKDEYGLGEKIQIDVNGMTLFGPPAANRLASAKVELEAFPFTPDQWKTFSFGDRSRTFTKAETILDSKNLDQEGNGVWEYAIPDKIEAAASVRAIISSTVLEPGGRGVTDYSGAIVHPTQSYVGIRKKVEGYAELDEDTQFEFVLTDTQGNPVSGQNLKMTLKRTYWNSAYRQVNGRYRWRSERATETVSTGNLTSGGGPKNVSVRPQDYGQHHLVITDTQTGGQSSFSFYVSGWGYAPWSLDEPEKVELDLDKEEYRLGDEATVQIRAPFPGKLILSVERDKVVSYQVLDMEENTATAKVKILQEHKPNVFISATLIRSTRDLKKDTPVRAFGVVPLTVNTEEEQLAINISAPDIAKPNSKLKVEVKVDGGDSSPFVTIAAVDEGILQLTDFQTPDPLNHFYGKKRLDVKTYDVYDYIMPELRTALLSTAGDVETARKRQLSPQTSRRVKPVAFWSGVVKTGRNRKASIELDVPEFNGTLRLMAVAFNNDNFGSSEAKTIIRNEIVLTPTFPRFLAPTDDFRVPLNVFNGTGGDAQFSVRASTSGPVSLSQSNYTVDVASEKEGLVYIPFTTQDGIGQAKIVLEVEGGGEKSKTEVEIPVRYASPSITSYGHGSVESGEGVSFRLPTNLSDLSDSYELTISGLPGIQFASNLDYLLEYPHGCLEQTTSKIFPLLYFSSLSEALNPNALQGNSSDYYLEQGIDKISSMQQFSGAFSYWARGTSTNDWSSIYATHFLVEARRKGHQIADRVYDKALDAVRVIARGNGGSKYWERNRRAYAVYVLSLANRPMKSLMNRLYDVELDELSLQAKYLLAGAFVHIGDKARARDLIPSNISVNDRKEMGRNFTSPLRSQAIMLNILSELDPKHPNIPKLIENIDRRLTQLGSRANTQERAFSLLGLGKVFQSRDKSDYTGTVTIDGVKIRDITEETVSLSSDDWKGKEVALNIEGSGLGYYQWTATGISTDQSFKEEDNELQVRRRFLSEAGSLILKGSDIKQGELLVVELSIKAPNQDVENVAVVDMLPSGLEIENSRLESRQGIKWIGEDVLTPDHMDIRDDRMIIYTNLKAGKTGKFYYAVRAITTGQFVLPPVRAEAMYAPEFNSVASSGSLNVIERVVLN